MFVFGGNNGGIRDDYKITNSLRTRSSASAYLSRTPASAGNRRTWTWSGWVKRGAISGAIQTLFGAASAGAGDTIYFTASETLAFYSDAFVGIQRQTTQLFRDPSAWYHIVVTLDTTSATAQNRCRFWINGSEVTVWTTNATISQNSQGYINNTVVHNISRNPANSAQYCDLYLTEINFIDGQALTPSSFGYTHPKTGVWRPKPYTGTYGTNGFYFKFSDIAITSGSNAGLGKDFSGNSNYWNTTNISVTSGTTYDAMTDVPTLTSATVANYAVLNPTNKGTSVTLSNGNLSYSWSSAGNAVVFSTIAVTSGKWYAEWTQGTTPSLGAMYVGIGADSNNPNHSWLGQNSTEYSYNNIAQKANNGTNTSYGASWTTNDVIGIAFDADARTLTFYKNGTSQGTAFTSIPAGTYYFGAGNNPSSTVTGHMNFGQRPFSYTPPTGFVALNTYNLPKVTIAKGNKVMDATLYTGTNATLSITNAGSFKPDLLWFKRRSSTGNHQLMDSVRGITKVIDSNTTGADQTSNAGTGVTSINSNGFTLGTDTTTDGYTNTNGFTFVTWQWQAGQGSTSTNTDGSITSTVSANATAGFSIVTYTGVASNTSTVGHGLGVAPSMIIIKYRDGATSWIVYHRSLGNTSSIMLNSTATSSSANNFWNSTSPTSSVFSVSYVSGVNGDVNFAGRNYIAYCWAEIAGFSKFGSYTGNGSTDGPFIYTGFRPKFIMTKRTDTTSAWIMVDTSRTPSNVANLSLDANTVDAEKTGGGGTTPFVDILSNGFKQRTTGTGTNASGGTYIYMAFAENPFKYSLAR